MLRNLRDAISSRGRKSIGNWLYRRIVRGGSINVSAGQRVTQRFQNEVHPSERLPFPLEFRNHNAVLENHSGRTTRPRKKFDDIFRRVASTQPSFDSKDRAMHICVVRLGKVPYSYWSLGGVLISLPKAMSP